MPFEMDDDSRTTCISPDCHDENIKDHLLHFLGCIEISERHSFLNDPEYKLWKQETKHWITKLQHVENRDKKLTDAEIEHEARNTSKAKRETWRDDCLSELRRIDFLRFKLKGDQQEKHLVDCVENSRNAWRESEEFKDNIHRVNAWSAGRRKYTPQPYEIPMKESVDKSHEPGRDVNAPFMQFEKGELSQGVFAPTNETLNGRQAIWGEYPNQMTTVQRLLYPEAGLANLLSKKKDEMRLKYFHIPSNNMLVSNPLPFLLPHRMRGLFHQGLVAPGHSNVAIAFGT